MRKEEREGDRNPDGLDSLKLLLGEAGVGRIRKALKVCGITEKPPRETVECLVLAEIWSASAKALRVRDVEVALVCLGFLQTLCGSSGSSRSLAVIAALDQLHAAIKDWHMNDQRTR